jgi:hypothetical protein
MGHHIGFAPNSQDLPSGNSDRLGAGLRGLHREDGASEENQVGGWGSHRNWMR